MKYVTPQLEYAGPTLAAIQSVPITKVICACVESHGSPNRRTISAYDADE